jgi:signal transduction histidine kinase
MDIRLVAKKAFVYGLAVAIVSAFIGFLSFGSSYVTETYPQFPVWLIPVTAAIVASGIGAFVWKKIRETDLLKHEFITIVMHKFRTPLTRIKWAAESIGEPGVLSGDRAKSGIENIKEGVFQLYELTNTLIGLTDSEATFSYHFRRLNLSVSVGELVAGMEKKAREKNIALSSRIQDGCFVSADSKRLRLILGNIVENAFIYTPPGGQISVSLETVGRSVVFRVSDTGVGIEKSDLPRIFTKFFRSKEAKMIDTEGIGIGLYVAKEVIRRHGGKISAASEGRGKGSIFTVELPAA